MSGRLVCCRGDACRRPCRNPARLRLLRTRMRKHSRSRPEGAPGHAARAWDAARASPTVSGQHQRATRAARLAPAQANTVCRTCRLRGKCDNATRPAALAGGAPCPGPSQYRLSHLPLARKVRQRHKTRRPCGRRALPRPKPIPFVALAACAESATTPQDPPPLRAARLAPAQANTVCRTCRLRGKCDKLPGWRALDKKTAWTSTPTGAMACIGTSMT